MATTFTGNLSFANPAVGDVNWNDEFYRNQFINDIINQNLKTKNRIITGLVVSDAGGLTINYTTGTALVNEVYYPITGSSDAVTGSGGVEYLSNYVYVDSTGNFTVSTTPPTGDFSMLAMVDTDSTSILRVVDLRCIQIEKIRELTVKEDINLSNTNFASQFGIIYKGSNRFIHNFSYGDNGTVTTFGANTFIGEFSGNLTAGSTAVNTYDASYNTFCGFNTGISLTTGWGNNLFGAYTGRLITTGFGNNAFGYNTLYNCTTGTNNSAQGGRCLYNLTIGSNNSNFGYESGFNLTNASGNTFVGAYAGKFISDGTTVNQLSTNCTLIGYLTKTSITNSVNENVIGYNAIGSGSNTTTIGNTSNTRTVNNGTLDIVGNLLRVRTQKTPASASATGNAGEWCNDADYLYVCTATNTWKRIALSTW